MIKHLLSLAAVASMALAANAAEIQLSLADLGSGWSSSYDGATQTLTFDSDWSGRGWWLGSADYSVYEEVCVEIENPGWYVQLAVQYNDADNTTQAAAFDENGVATVVLDEALKNDVMQIYIQSSTAGSFKLVNAVVRNSLPAEEWDSKVLFEGEETLDWYPGLTIDKNLIIEAGAGAQMVTDVTFSGDGYSYKYGINWTNDVLPSFKEMEGYQAEWLTVWTNQPTLTFTFTEADIEALQKDGDSNLHISGDGGVITKVTLNKAGNSVVAITPSAEEDVYYNMQGIRVATPTKGLYIHNGKKIIL